MMAVQSQRCFQPEGDMMFLSFNVVSLQQLQDNKECAVYLEPSL